MIDDICGYHRNTTSKPGGELCFYPCMSAQMYTWAGVHEASYPGKEDFFSIFIFRGENSGCTGRLKRHFSKDGNLNLQHLSPCCNCRLSYSTALSDGSLCLTVFRKVARGEGRGWRNHCRVTMVAVLRRREHSRQGEKVKRILIG